jgi:tetratricopeptide (TPR) repeat protein
MLLWRRFLARHGDHSGVTRARLGLAQALLAEGRTQEADKAFTEVWLRSPASPEAEDAARQLKTMGETGLAGPPPTTREKLERAERLLAAGRGETAQLEAEALLADGLPTDQRSRALKIVFEVARRSGRSEDAKAAITRALTSLPPEARRPWLLDLARLQKPKNRDEAMATLDKLAREYPKTPEAADALLTKGRILERRRSSRRPRTYRKVAAELSGEPDGTAALWRMGWFDWFPWRVCRCRVDVVRILTVRGGPAHRETVSYWLARADEMRGETALAAKAFAQIRTTRRGPTTACWPRSGAGDQPPRPQRLRPCHSIRSSFSSGRQLRTSRSAADRRPHALRRRGDGGDDGGAGDSKLQYALAAACVEDARYHLALRILRRLSSRWHETATPRRPRVLGNVYPMGLAHEADRCRRPRRNRSPAGGAVVRARSPRTIPARSESGPRADAAHARYGTVMAQARRLPVDGSGGFLGDPSTNLELGSAISAGPFASSAMRASPWPPTTRARPAREWWGARRSPDLDAWVSRSLRRDPHLREARDALVG